MSALNASSEKRCADCRAAWRMSSKEAAVSGEVAASRAEASAQAYSSGVAAKYPIVTASHRTAIRMDIW